MPRFNERKFQLMDIVGRFEAKPSSEHTRNACGAMGRLKDDGAAFWDEGSDQLSRWRESCDILWTLLNNLEERRYIRKQDLATVLREFIQELEHSTDRMYQMLYGTSDDADNDPAVERILRWIDLVYRLSTYAIISTWIDDKTEEVSVKISMNLTTGKHTKEWTRKEMQVPSRYRRATKNMK